MPLSYAGISLIAKSMLETSQSLVEKDLRSQIRAYNLKDLAERDLPYKPIFKSNQ